MQNGFFSDGGEESFFDNWMDSIIRLALASCSAARILGTATVFKVKSPGIVQVHGFASLARRRKGRGLTCKEGG